MFRSKILSLLGLAAIVGSDARLASAQPYRPDAAGFPCSTQRQLTIVEDRQVFSIVPVTPSDAPMPGGDPVLIGTGLHVDRSLFDLGHANTKEAHDAQPR